MAENRIQRTTHITWKKLVAIIATLASLLAVTLGTSLASAAEGKLVDAVTDITVDKTEMEQYTTVDAHVSWVAPAGTVAGDYFTVGLPAEFSNLSTTGFNLTSPDGEVVAQCKVEVQTVTCTFTDYVSTHGDVHGDMKLIIRADQSNDGDKGHWEINGKTDDTKPVPDVDPYDPGPMPGPDDFTKDGWGASQDGDDVITWAIMIGSQKFLFDGKPVVITDVIDEKMTLYPDYEHFIPNIRFTDNKGWSNDTWDTMTLGTDFTMTTDSAAHSFSITFNEDSALVKKAVGMANSGDFVSELFYNTRPYQPKKGETYTNHVEATGGSSADANYKWDAAGGNGEGIGANAKLVKKDAESGQTLKGAVFNLVAGKDGKGAVIESGLTTDASGAIEVKGLFKGNYSFVETTAPQGYKLAGPLNFTIDDATFEQGASVTLSLDDARVEGQVSWSKVDAASPTTLLAGSEWSLTGKDGKVLQVIDNGAHDTDPAAGKISVGNLAWGTYTLKETKAPEGYQISGDETSFTVDSAHTVIQLPSITNKKTVPPVPSKPGETAKPVVASGGKLAKTGSDISSVVIGTAIAAALAVSLLVGVAIKRRRS